MKATVPYFPSMNQPRYLIILFLLLHFGTRLKAQSKRELRGVWITTQFNLDWPSKPGLEARVQQEELSDIFANLVSLNFNAVFLQVRGAGDALYPSAYAPWAKVLSGRLGTPPEPLYDPLSFALKEAHHSGLEFHAWMNPFRVAQSFSEDTDFPARHIYRKHPEWCLAYARKLYLDPGIPAARAYLIEVIEELLRQYEVDGLHFDDYFYPYPSAGLEFPDSSSYRLYNPDSLERGGWRRQNINRFIEGVRESLLRLRPEIEFGISSFGVWRNLEDDKRGSATRAGIRSYDDLYADVLYWIEEGWIDYVLPQLYFSRSLKAADFDVLIDWWERVGNRVDLYIGHSLYKIGNNPDPQWQDPGEMPAQIASARQKSRGSVFFRYGFLEKNPLGIRDSLANHLYQQPAILPLENYGFQPRPLFPLGLRVRSRKGGIILNWDDDTDKRGYYAIYKSVGKTAVNTSQAHLFALHHGDINSWQDTTAKLLKKYHYKMTRLDTHHQESSPSYELEVRHFWGWKKWLQGLFTK